MIRNISRPAWTAAWVLAAGVGLVLTAASARAIGPILPEHKVGVVADYYAPPATPYGVGAQMSPTPHWVPPRVGWTDITYPPFAPQEFLYHHSEVHAADGTRTCVHFGGYNVARNVHWFFHGLPNKSTKFQ
jgi:hypothetical protein